jgi:branched-chain amino acid aminotransferase/4-amino-4-deoxychorismate lyase
VPSGVPADDRGFTLGDGLFETVLAEAGAMPRLAAHVARLSAGCAVIGLPAPEPAAVEAAAYAALADAGLTSARAAVRLTLTAGSGGRGLDRPATPTPRLIAAAALAPKPDQPARLAVAGVRRNDRSPASRLKTMAYLDNVLAREEARRAGADEAVMLNTTGAVACAGAANLFWVEGDTLVTPALDCGVLAGIMRAAVIACAPQFGITVRETTAGLDVLLAADAVFLTNSLIGLRPVAAIDAAAFATWPPIIQLENACLSLRA